MCFGKPQSVKIVQGMILYPLAEDKQGILHTFILYYIQNLYYLTPSPSLPIYMQFIFHQRWKDGNIWMPAGLSS